jgi:hypothetical protein
VRGGDLEAEEAGGLSAGAVGEGALMRGAKSRAQRLRAVNPGVHLCGGVILAMAGIKPAPRTFSAARGLVLVANIHRRMTG